MFPPDDRENTESQDVDTEVIHTPSAEILRVSEDCKPIALIDPNTDTLTRPPLPDGFVDNDGIIVPREEKVPDVLLPTQEDIDRYQPEKDIAESFQQDLLLFTSMPWKFFDKKLVRNGVESPVKEIEERVEEGKGLDTTDLKYNEWEKVKSSGEVPEAFYVAMEETTELLVEETIKDRQFVDSFFRHLNSIIETQIYHNRCLKLNNPKVVEGVLEKFTQAGVMIPDSVCDFISYFEIPPSFVNDIDVILNEKSKHPLKYYIDAKKEVEIAGEEGQYENIGIELEGFPVISIGDSC